MEIIREGTAYDFSPSAAGNLAYLVSDTGWGMAPLHRLAQRGPQQDGETDKGLRLDPRIGQLVFDITAETWGELQSKREQFLALFSPTSDPLIVKWNRTAVRYIDVYYLGDLSFSSGDRSGFIQRVAISLKAPDPTFYSPTVGTKTISLGGGSDTLTIPMSVPHKVGASTADVLSTISYPGTWHSFPHMVRIIGPITDPVIENLTTGEVLDFTGTTISGGDYYELDLRYGQKTIINSSGVNKIADLTDDSDLATWHIEKGPEVGTLTSPKQNSIRVQGTSITSTAQVEIAYYIRYLGV